MTSVIKMINFLGFGAIALCDRFESAGDDDVDDTDNDDDTDAVDDKGIGEVFVKTWISFIARRCVKYISVCPV